MSNFVGLSFTEKEQICRRIFDENGPYWHLYTDGTMMQDIFCGAEDFDVGMWVLASVVCQVDGVEVLTFELMGNHVHLIMSGRRDLCLQLFGLFKSRLARVMRRLGRIVDWSRFNAEILEISDLKSLRNEIIYVNRNAYVVNPKYSPSSYPWGGGCAFFSPWLDYVCVKDFMDLSIDRRRELLHSRDVSLCSGLKMVGGRVFIPSFCRIDLGESMFIDPRSYFNMLTRNAEAFSQIAQRLKDSIFLTDDEMYSALVSHINKEYGIRNVAHLDPKQKMECADYLHYKLRANRQQIRRILRLEDNVLAELYP